MTRTRRLLVAAFALLALPLGACSINPVYEVRVVNASAVPVVASIVNVRLANGRDTLAQARIAPNAEAVLGAAEAPPMEQVELHIVRTNELGALPARHRISRGVWTATINKAPPEAWDPFMVTLEKD